MKANLDTKANQTDRNIWHLASYYESSSLYRHLFQELSNLGYQQTVFSPRGFSTLTDQSPNIRFCGKQIWTKLDRVLFSRKIKKYNTLISESMGQNPPSLIHAHTLFSDGFAAAKLSLETGAPYIITVRSTDLYIFSKYFHHLHHDARQVLANAHKVIFVNNSYEKKLTNSLKTNISQHKIEIIPNGIDNFWLENPPQPSTFRQKGSIQVISVGDVIRRKNHKVVIEAINKLNLLKDSTTYKLVIVGDFNTKFGISLKRKYESDKISFVGKQPREKIREYFNTADIFVLLSRIETFGLVYAEALSQGLPIIFTAEQGFDGWISGRSWARPAESDDHQKLGKLIVDMVGRDLPNLEAIDATHSLFLWPTIAKKLSAAYAETLSSP